MGNTQQLEHQHSKNAQSSNFDVQSYVREGISFQDVIHIRQAFEGLRDDNDGTSSNEVRLSKLRIFPFFNKYDLARLPGEINRGGQSNRTMDQLQQNVNDSFTLHNPGLPQDHLIDPTQQTGRDCGTGQYQLDDMPNALSAQQNLSNRAASKNNNTTVSHHLAPGTTAQFGYKDQDNLNSTSGLPRQQHMRLESKGIDCETIMCGCSQNPKGIRTTNGQAQLITNGGSYSQQNNNRVDVNSGESQASGPPVIVTFDQFYEIMCEKIKESRPNQNIIFESSQRQPWDRAKKFIPSTYRTEV